MIYVPVLKWKRGEQKALELLPPEVKQHIMPVIEICSIPYDFVKEQPQKTIDEHLADIAVTIHNSWEQEQPIFLDGYWLDASERMNNGLHPLKYIFNQTREMGLQVVPITGSQRDVAYQHEVQEIIRIDRLGVGIRLEDDDFLNVPGTISSLLTLLELKPQEVDLIIDLQTISPSEEKTTLIGLVGIISSIPNINEWRNLILCGSAFPETLSSVSANSIQEIPRSEWKIWKQLRSLALARIPIFGDYAINHPVIIEVDPRIIRMSANIRYCVDDNWLIIKGRNVRDHGYEQYYSLAEQLINHHAYMGPDFSWGDKFIRTCALDKDKSGNATTWRSVGTNHHITYIISQLASSPSP